MCCGNLKRKPSQTLGRSIRLYFCTADAEEFSAFIDSKTSDENVSKAQTLHDSDSQSGLGAKEKDKAANSGLLDHFMKIFLYCRRAMVRQSFLFAHDINLGP